MSLKEFRRYLYNGLKYVMSTWSWVISKENVLNLSSWRHILEEMYMPLKM